MRVKENRVTYKASENIVTLPLIEKVVERIVNKKLQTLLRDPDYGVELRAEFKQKLNSVLKHKKKTIPEEEIAKKYGVKFNV